METFFRLHACCIPVKGARRSTICDLQRDSYVLVPNVIYDLLVDEIEYMSLENLVEELGDDKVISWLDKLVEEEYGFYTMDKTLTQNLKKIDLTYYGLTPITNAIIDFDTFSTHHLADIFNQLSNFLCEAIELRFFCPQTPESILEILQLTKHTTFRSVQVIVAYNEHFSSEVVAQLFEKYPRLNKLVFHSCNDNYIKEIPEDRMLIYTDAIINSESHCGVVSPGYFSSNMFLFTEGQKFNSCLNRKISIDKYGNIKNCPSHVKSYGNIKETSLAKVLETKEFKEVWDVNKDMIDICRDCEFRYMCQDCRAYLKDSNNPLSKPLKCNYNPYEAVWE